MFFLFCRNVKFVRDERILRKKNVSVITSAPWSNRIIPLKYYFRIFKIDATFFIKHCSTIKETEKLHFDLFISNFETLKAINGISRDFSVNN